MARPTDYNPEILEKAKQYLDMKRPNDDEVIPSIEGLALHLELSRETIYDWSRQEEKKAFSDIVGDVLSKQGRSLVNKGLDGSYNPTIAKLMLSKHGYKEATETDITTKGDKIDSSVDIKAIASKVAEELKGIKT